MSDTYHHGNLRETLIEAGIRIINECGEDAVDAAADSENAIVSMGKRYVSFFRSNPDYYKFLFGHQNIIAHLRIDEKTDDDYPPFLLLKRTYLKYLKECGIKRDKKEQEIELLKIWASAHGLAAIACMAGVIPSFDWDATIKPGMSMQ